MATKKAPAKKSVTKSAKTSKADASIRELIKQHNCLQKHVIILTVLSGLLFVSVIVFGVILLNCDDCKAPKPTNRDDSSKIEKVEKIEESVEEEVPEL